jgi:ABC-type nitrate/sulfonate/bicarbonate transport system ATPase subunit
MTLRIRNLWKSYPVGPSMQHVLRGVELEIEPQQFVTLIGHSGCGKSTLLNVVGGLTPADHGGVVLDGDVITGPGPDRAFVFQNYSLLPRLSLVDNVAVAVRAARPTWSTGKVDDHVERYLGAVGLWEQRVKRPWQVSGGMQQRCAVARAFAVEPRVLLLDEPFGALDALTRGKLQQQLVELWQNGSDTEIVLMVTHGVDEAILLSDRIVVMGNPPDESVVADIRVDLPRPRSADVVSLDPVGRALTHEVLRLLGAYTEVETLVPVTAGGGSIEWRTSESEGSSPWSG